MRCRLIPSSKPLLAASAAMIAVIPASPRRATLQGMTYTMRVSEADSSTTTLAGTRETIRWGFTAVVTVAAGRGRMDIVDGNNFREFGTGDYVLFDSVDYIVVHPTTRSFFGPAASASILEAKKTAAALTVAAPDRVLKNATVSVDTIGPNGTVGGLQAQHVRITQAYASASVSTPSTVDSKRTDDVWFADVAGLVPNPFSTWPTAAESQAEEAVRNLQGGVDKQLGDQRAAAIAGMGAGKVVVKSVKFSTYTTTRSDGTASGTMEIDGVQRADVDPAQLSLPSGFTETVNPWATVYGVRPPLSKDGGAKWRAKVAGGE